jgi:hypothetical protein
VLQMLHASAAAQAAGVDGENGVGHAERRGLYTARILGETRVCRMR